jgi:hypothetical protein
MYSWLTHGVSAGAARAIEQGAAALAPALASQRDGGADGPF